MFEVSYSFLKVYIYRNLKQINLACLPGIKNREAALKLLKNELPHCVITYNDAYSSASELKEK
jgi:hypothetical protein